MCDNLQIDCVLPVQYTNFMAYAYDSCTVMFTPDQSEVMYFWANLLPFKQNVACSTIDPIAVDCQTTILDFSEPGISWTTNALDESISYPNLDFSIHIQDPSNILEYADDYHEGIQIGIDPHNMSDSLVITYTFSESVNFVQFKISDLDRKEYGPGYSNQQEAVTIYGLKNSEFSSPITVLPELTSFEGSVTINGNHAQATTGSEQSHEEESILITFTECVDEIIIIYGTGNDSPVTNPTYSKIQIGAEFGFITENCFPNQCDLNCEGLGRLDFSKELLAISGIGQGGIYSVGDQIYSIHIDDPSQILSNSFVRNRGIGVRINPHTIDETLQTHYGLSQISQYTAFDIADIEYKPEEMQHEKITVIGTLGGVEVMPALYSLSGSVEILANSAIGTTGSSDEFDESILVIFEQAIDGFTIIQSTAEESNFTNPGRSKIIIGNSIGVFTGECGVASCPDSLALDNVGLDNSLYQANVSITSTSQVNSFSIVSFKASNCIELNSGFEVVENAVFQVILEACEN